MYSCLKSHSSYFVKDEECHREWNCRVQMYYNDFWSSDTGDSIAHLASFSSLQLAGLCLSFSLYVCLVLDCNGNLWTSNTTVSMLFQCCLSVCFACATHIIYVKIASNKISFTMIPVHIVSAVHRFFANWNHLKWKTNCMVIVLGQSQHQILRKNIQKVDFGSRHTPDHIRNVHFKSNVHKVQSIYGCKWIGFYRISSAWMNHIRWPRILFRRLSIR